MITKRKSGKLKFIFFGTDEFSVIVLEELKRAGYMPALIATAPDRPKGRGMKLAPPPAKVWAGKNDIKYIQPETIKNLKSYILNLKLDLFVVASYGKIIPKELIDIPKHGSLNVHPSLLPLYRGPSPIQSQILDGAEKTGVTIMLMDEKMDHGPILAVRELEFSISNFQFSKLRDELARLGGRLLVEIIPKWVAGEIKPHEQEHAQATYTKKLTKENGLIDLADDHARNWRKFLAFGTRPGVYFFEKRGGKKIRIKITDAELKTGRFIIRKIIPEGKREMPYAY